MTEPPFAGGLPEEAEPWEEEEPSTGWQEPVYCPECGSREVQLIELRHEMGCYTCDACGCSFEEEK